MMMKLFAAPLQIIAQPKAAALAKHLPQVCRLSDTLRRLFLLSHTCALTPLSSTSTTPL
jgi:hypothetical protein